MHMLLTHIILLVLYFKHVHGIRKLQINKSSTAIDISQQYLQLGRCLVGCCISFSLSFPQLRTKTYKASLHFLRYREGLFSLLWPAIQLPCLGSHSFIKWRKKFVSRTNSCWNKIPHITLHILFVSLQTFDRKEKITIM